ncbi:unnamed protein product [Psylliodes chrysocephalus]|uniref:Uncharacterized protein n=1 Tax=Psylliodes chrysocephalus TaxID=3402493 RepID=A0A9P0GCK4_9CUCU|nr:unnamed protein product [Psylliodes chrysocephala]
MYLVRPFAEMTDATVWLSAIVQVDSDNLDCKSDPHGSDDSVVDPSYNPPKIPITEMLAEIPTNIRGAKMKVKYHSNNEKIGRKRLTHTSTWQKTNARSLQNSGEAYLSIDENEDLDQVPTNNDAKSEEDVDSDQVSVNNNAESSGDDENNSDALNKNRAVKSSVPNNTVFQKDQFVVVKFEANKRNLNFVGKIEDIHGDFCTINFLRKKFSKKVCRSKYYYFVYPDVPDRSIVYNEDIKILLRNPIDLRRNRIQFREDLNYDFIG